MFQGPALSVNEEHFWPSADVVMRLDYGAFRVVADVRVRSIECFGLRSTR